jgi:exoribonuclease R
LRRLVDRYVGETCVALCAGQPIPEWVLGALPGLPATMQASSQRANRFERAVIDLTEAITLSPRIGESFAGAIVELGRDPKQGVAMLRNPAIEAPVTSNVPLPLGEGVELKLVEADPGKRSTRFELVD